MLIPRMKFRDVEEFSSKYIGTVVDTKDPRKLGRVKVFIEGKFEVPKEFLPWCFPQLPVGSGGSNGTGGFDIPEEGAQLIVEFPTKDIYFPVYTGHYISSLTAPLEGFSENYPMVTSKRDSSGNITKVDKSTGTMSTQHRSGSGIKFKEDGSVVISSKKGIKLESLTNQQGHFEDFEHPERVKRKETSVVKADKSIQDAKSHIVRGGGIREDISGGRTSVYGGGLQELVGADHSSSVGGSKVSTVALDNKVLAGGQNELVVALGDSTTVLLGDVVRLLVAGNHDITVTAGDVSRTIVAGNYSVDVVAGNISSTTAVGNVSMETSLGDVSMSTSAGDIEATTSLGNLSLKTSAGAIDLSTLLSSIKLDETGGLKLDLTTNAEITALVQAVIMAPLVRLGSGAGESGVLTFLLNPISDTITGRPNVPSVTVLASV